MGFLVLINQLICKFSTLVRDILEEIYPAVAGRIFNILPRDPFPSGPESSTEVTRLVNFIVQLVSIFISHVLGMLILCKLFGCQYMSCIRCSYVVPFLLFIGQYITFYQLKKKNSVQASGLYFSPQVNDYNNWMPLIISCVTLTCFYCMMIKAEA